MFTVTRVRVESWNQNGALLVIINRKNKARNQMLWTGPLMSIMAESGHAENDVYLERPAATRVSNKQIEEAKLSAALQFVDFYFLLHC